MARGTPCPQRQPARPGRCHLPVDSNNDLIWYKHLGHQGDGLQTWKGGIKVGQGWGAASRVFSGGPGILYMIDRQGDLYWYRHDGYANGTANWTGAVKLGNGWDTIPDVFSGGEGVIYAMRRDGSLYWYRHTGFADGSPTWVNSAGDPIGSGWPKW